MSSMLSHLGVCLVFLCALGCAPEDSSDRSGGSWTEDVGAASGGESGGEGLEPHAQEGGEETGLSAPMSPESWEVLPAQYPAGRELSPITPVVAKRIQEIASIDFELASDVFMKVGASSTVSPHFLTCLATEEVVLDESEAWAPALEFYGNGDAAGVSPYERETLAAKVGVSANWVLAGNPSPLEQEMLALSPTVAFIHYGTNDMQLGTTYQSAMWGFGANLMALVDTLIAQGVVPVLSTLAPREDMVDAAYWVPAYAAVTRGIAQARQVPVMDLHASLQGIPGQGLAGDGVHLNKYVESGSARPCVFTNEGLQFGHNVRNHLHLGALSALHRVIAEQEPGWEEADVLSGDGSSEAPFQISSLPFSALADTRDSPHRELDLYSGCLASQDESGPEHLYRLELDSPTHVRAMVHALSGADVDVHLLDASASEEGCIARGHRIVQGLLPAGTWYFALDTFVAAGEELSGEYLFTLVECEDGDPDCASWES